MTETHPDRVQFSYWTDPLCIWAFVAQSRLERILSVHTDQLAVEYRVVPVFDSVPWRFREGPWKDAGVEGRIDATRRVAREFGHEDVSGRCWATATPTSSWGPGAAIKAVFALEVAGDVEAGAGAAYQVALRRAFFVDERNICHRDTQLELAEAQSLPRASIETQLDDGSALAALCEDNRRKEALRIQGSPTYVFADGRAQLYGNFPFEVLEATVEALTSGAEPRGSNC